jgi:FKBP-type peptidyl-prolyl cis-trans isomerase SlyD
MTAEKDKFVSIHYTLKNDDGEILDSSVEKNQTLDYVHGREYLLPKLEEAITGKNPGEKFSVVLEPADGYGEYRKEFVAEVDRKNFETDAPIEVGMAFQAMTAMGPQVVRVVKVGDEKITVDANHELAGVRLHFDVEIINVRDATEEELNPSCSGGCGNCGGECSGGSCEGGCGEGNGCGGGCCQI